MAETNFYTQVGTEQQGWYQVTKETIKTIDSVETSVENVRGDLSELSSNIVADKEDLYSFSIPDVNPINATLIDNTQVELVTSAYMSSRNIKVADINDIHVGNEYYITNYNHSELIVIDEIKTLRDRFYLDGIVRHVYEILLKNVLRHSYTVDSDNHAYIVKTNMSQQQVESVTTKKARQTKVTEKVFSPTSIIINSESDHYTAKVTTGVINNIVECVVESTEENGTKQTLTIPATILPTPTGTKTNTAYTINIGDISAVSKITFKQVVEEDVSYTDTVQRYSYKFKEPVKKTNLTTVNNNVIKTNLSPTNSQVEVSSTKIQLQSDTTNVIISSYYAQFQLRVPTTQHFEVSNSSNDNTKAVFTWYPDNTAYIGKGITTRNDTDINEDSKLNTEFIRVKRFYRQGNSTVSSSWETLQESCGKVAAYIRVATCCTNENKSVQSGYPESENTPEKQEAYRLAEGTVRIPLLVKYADGTNMSGDIEQASVYTKTYYPKTSFSRVNFTSTLFDLSNESIPTTFISFVSNRSTRNLLNVFRVSDTEEQTGDYKNTNSGLLKAYGFCPQDGKNPQYFVIPEEIYPSQTNETNPSVFFRRRTASKGFVKLTLGTFTEAKYDGSSVIEASSTGFFSYDRSNDALRIKAHDNYIKFPAEKAISAAVSSLLNIGIVFDYFYNMIDTVEKNENSKQEDEQISNLDDIITAIRNQADKVKDVFYTNEYSYTRYKDSKTKDKVVKVKGILELAKSIRDMEFLCTNGSREAIHNNYYPLLAYPLNNPTTYPLAELYNAIADLRMTVIDFLKLTSDIALEEDTTLTESSDISVLETEENKETVSGIFGRVSFTLFDSIKLVISACEQAQIAVVATRWNDISNDLSNANSVAKTISKQYGYFRFKNFTSKESTDLAKKRVQVVYGDNAYSITSGDTTTYYALEGALGSCNSVVEDAFNITDTLNKVYVQELTLDFSQLSNYCYFFVFPNRTGWYEPTPVPNLDNVYQLKSTLPVKVPGYAFKIQARTIDRTTNEETLLKYGSNADFAFNVTIPASQGTFTDGSETQNRIKLQSPLAAGKKLLVRHCASVNKYILGISSDTGIKCNVRDFSDNIQHVSKPVKGDLNIDVSTLKVYIDNIFLPQYADPTMPWSTPNWTFDPTDSALYIYNRILTDNNSVQCTYDYNLDEEKWLLMNTSNIFNVKNDNEKTIKCSYNIPQNSEQAHGFKFKTSAGLSTRNISIRQLYPIQNLAEPWLTVTHSLLKNSLEQNGFEIHKGNPSLCTVEAIKALKVPDGISEEEKEHNTKIKVKLGLIPPSGEISQYATVQTTIAEKQMLNPYTQQWSTVRRFTIKNQAKTGYYVDISDIINEHDEVRTDATYKYYTWTAYSGTGLSSGNSLLKEVTTASGLQPNQYFIDMYNRELTLCVPKRAGLGQFNINTPYLSPMFLIHKDYIPNLITELEDNEIGFFTYLYGDTDTYGTKAWLRKDDSGKYTKKPSQLVSVPIEIGVCRADVSEWQNYLPENYTLHYGPNYTTKTVHELLKGKTTYIDRKVQYLEAEVDSNPELLEVRHNRIHWIFKWFDVPTMTAFNCSWT